jgi:hypothetical protein
MRGAGYRGSVPTPPSNELGEHMRGRLVVPILSVLLVAGCGGSGGSSSKDVPLGTEEIVTHTQDLGTGAAKPRTLLGITPLAVRKGTQAELKAAGFTLDGDALSATPYYADVRFTNKGTAAVKRQLYISLEDKDGNLLSSTSVISLDGKPYEKCKTVSDGELLPGKSYETCSLFLVPKGKEPARVSFLPNDPGNETQFVYWKVK